ncbi:hypothetical protein JUN65_08245 [Gluconacetobacter azotocaptans]|uniref:hypothetical protein n=1 Tax=Gluconacetobacter azotocaptans TaxID=142834 RepID=UPI00195BC9A0|nr:hypothetical protein [Gluconacetobacter azotocaptans]MBM9401575.1 hypothetical protein [Gluconacetobacter azotocaptans]
MARTFEQIDRGPSPGEKYALAKPAKDRWAGHVIVEFTGKSDDQASKILKTWKENGVFIEGEYRSSALQRRMTGCITVSPDKMSEMRQLAATYPSDDGDEE